MERFSSGSSIARGAEVLALTGHGLHPGVIGTLPSGPVRVEIGPEARGVVLRAWAGAEAVARTKAVYGRTTGVGANRTTEIQQATDF